MTLAEVRRRRDVIEEVQQTGGPFMSSMSDDFARRVNDARESGDAEVKILERYFAVKDGPNADELAAARRGIIDAAYEAIGMAREKLQSVAPGETIAWPVWTTHVEGGREFVGSLAEENFVARYTSKDAIFMHPDLLTVLTPREIAAVYAHEAGHDIDNLERQDSQFAKQAECRADHVALTLGYGNENAAALGKIAAVLGGVDQSAYPTLRDRMAAAADQARMALPIGSVAFDDRCRLVPGTSLEKPDTPSIPTSRPAGHGLGG